MFSWILPLHKQAHRSREEQKESTCYLNQQRQRDFGEARYESHATGRPFNNTELDLSVYWVLLILETLYQQF
jgi:hypothetical protein